MRVLVAADGECSLTKELLNTRVGKIDRVVVADGALRHIDALGLTPDYIVGDLDSVDKDLLNKYKSSKIEKYPRDKDKTDLEIALIKALTLSPTELVFIGMFGGRIDHQFGNVLLLTTLKVDKIQIEDFDTTSFILNDSNAISLSRSTGFSLIPLTSEVTGVTIQGAKWRLEDHKLLLGSPTALCNEFLNDTAQISIESGSLLVVQRH